MSQAFSLSMTLIVTAAKLQSTPPGPSQLLHYANSTFAFQKWWIIDPTIVPPPNQMNWAMHQLGEL